MKLGATKDRCLSAPTDEDLDSLRRHLIQQGLTTQQAHDRAWEMVREHYLFLPPKQ